MINAKETPSAGQALRQERLQVRALCQIPARLDQLRTLGLTDHGVAQIVELFLKQTVGHGIL